MCSVNDNMVGQHAIQYGCNGNSETWQSLHGRRGGTGDCGYLVGDSLLGNALGFLGESRGTGNDEPLITISPSVLRVGVLSKSASISCEIRGSKEFVGSSYTHMSGLI